MGKDGQNQPEYGHIKIDNVGKIYDPEGIHVVAVENFSMEIKAGEFMVIVGPSGCGKTTLLNAIAGFSNLTSGNIYLDGQMIASPKIVQKPGADRTVVFQNGSLFPWKTVINNLIYGPVIQNKMSRDQAVDEAREIMANLGITRDIEDLYPGNLSSGMLRQIEIIRALINKPKVLLMDEPFRALDSTTKSYIHEYLLEVFEMTRTSIFFITHDLDEAIFLADRVGIMTTRPGTLKSIINVDIPRPRGIKALASKKYMDYKREAWEAVREESMKAFEAGERELA